ncbi:unnamed protein product [Rhizophagus irregularis]|uniref:Uncharacterized protein n=1 Tax=Rhizophagus irregularis TaxID=588596 RepID=A0A915Z1P2_9GLOM|nr:unnamed protein product [Rhizophagus irregularis]
MTNDQMTKDANDSHFRTLAELELDIETESSSSQNLSIKTQNSSKRNIEELNLETDDDNVGKRNKTR